MERISISVIMLSAVIASGSAFAGSCPRDMKEIDAALAKMPSISAANMSSVKDLRAKGEMLHKSGDHSGSVKALHEAKHLLGM